jgi:hypothetical protein
MPDKGWIRLWIVLSAVGVPVAALLLEQAEWDRWSALDRTGIQICVQTTHDYASEQACVRRLGADKTMFEHEGVTPARYWAQAIGIVFLLDLILTAVLIGAYFCARWVVRGFREVQ